METIINAWLSVWLYVMAAIAIVLGIQICKNRKSWDKINILCTLAVIVLVLHVLEEWVLPGGLHYSYNIDHGSAILSRYPMNRLTDMITNFGGVILGCIVLKFWGFRKSAGVAVMLFSAFEVVIHIVIGITSMKTFGNYGMNTLYSPGLVTSLFGFLPIVILDDNNDGGSSFLRNMQNGQNRSTVAIFTIMISSLHALAHAVQHWLMPLIII